MDLGRKITGGKYHKRRKRRLHEKHNNTRYTFLGNTKIKQFRIKGGNKKDTLLKSNIANVLIGKKVQKSEIKNVLETPQNRFFARQNILMKGAIIETSAGKAKITNRPSQEGHINAVLLKEN